MSSITLVAYEEAKKILAGCIDAVGMKASLNQAYWQIWARDSMITFLGAGLLPDEKVIVSFRTTLTTLAKYQSELGHIPLYVDPVNLRIGKDNAGAIDSNLWYIIGHYYYYCLHHDTEFLNKGYSSLEKALLWLRYQDSNDCGLLEMHEAADWADLLANRYNCLYCNVLYYAALKLMACMASSCGREGHNYGKLAEDVKEKINLLMWIAWDGNIDSRGKKIKEVHEKYPEWHWVYEKMAANIWISSYYVPYVAFRDYADRFDTFGNLLSIVLGVADTEKTNSILDYIHKAGIAEPYPIKAIYPPIMPGDKDWREYYQNLNLNYPNQCQNGGIWPFLGGFYVVALIKAGRFSEAERQLMKLAEVNRLGGQGREWEFNEWCDGLTGRPMRMAGQAWSAGMYIYAYESLKKKAVPILGEI